MPPLVVLALPQIPVPGQPPFGTAAGGALRRTDQPRIRASVKRFRPISLAAMLAVCALLSPSLYPMAAMAQEPVEAAACRKASIETLKQSEGNSPLKDVKIDLDSLTIAKTKAEIGGTKITTVVIGQAAIQREQSDEPHTFLCLLGEKEKVLMTFFTKR